MNTKIIGILSLFFSMVLVLNIGQLFAQQEFTIFSPDKVIKTTITLDKQITYQVEYNSDAIVSPSKIAMEVEGKGVLGVQPELRSTDRRTVDETVKPVVQEKRSTIRNHFDELTLEFENDFSLIFRAYNNGMAYRFKTQFEEEQIKIVSESVHINFSDNHEVFFPEENSFYTHSERYYKVESFSEIGPERQAVVPTLVNINRGPNVVVTEADLISYPGMFLRGTDNYGFQGAFPNVVTKEDQQTDRDVVPIERANYMAETEGSRTFPWRILIMESRDTGLVDNQLVYLLSKPLQLEDTSWLKPGMVAWDWYNANNIFDVDFEAGINTETYKYYIDFASKYGLDYIILDEGWYELGDLTSINPDIDVAELVEYGRKKGVDIILWVVWKTLEDQFDIAFDNFEEWGIKGIKVDFMQRDDQWMVDYYWRVAEETAERKMLVDFHGSYSPKGIRRAYPNVITREGVNGLEQNKWSTQLTPEHNVTLPFTRMVNGPMDYTPGAMVNAQQANFRPIFTRPMSMGTRCHQLAMYLVYESPLQMLADSPSQYLQEPQIMEYLSAVPTVWDETRVINGQVGDYILIARKRGNTWYVGAMTDGAPRKLHLDLSFLDNGKYEASIYSDGSNAHRYASDYDYSVKQVTSETSMNIQLAPGGGWAAIIAPK